MMRYRLHQLRTLLDTPVGFTLMFVTFGPIVG